MSKTAQICCSFEGSFDLSISYEPVHADFEKVCKGLAKTITQQSLTLRSAAHAIWSLPIEKVALCTSVSRKVGIFFPSKKFATSHVCHVLCALSEDEAENFCSAVSFAMLEFLTPQHSTNDHCQLFHGEDQKMTSQSPQIWSTKSSPNQHQSTQFTRITSSLRSITSPSQIKSTNSCFSYNRSSKSEANMYPLLGSPEDRALVESNSPHSSVNFGSNDTRSFSTRRHCANSFHQSFARPHTPKHSRPTPSPSISFHVSPNRMKCSLSALSIMSDSTCSDLTATDKDDDSEFRGRSLYRERSNNVVNRLVNNQETRNITLLQFERKSQYDCKQSHPKHNGWKSNNREGYHSLTGNVNSLYQQRNNLGWSKLARSASQRSLISNSSGSSKQSHIERNIHIPQPVRRGMMRPGRRPIDLQRMREKLILLSGYCNPPEVAGNEHIESDLCSLLSQIEVESRRCYEQINAEPLELAANQASSGAFQRFDLSSMSDTLSKRNTTKPCTRIVTSSETTSISDHIASDEKTDLGANREQAAFGDFGIQSSCSVEEERLSLSSSQKHEHTMMLPTHDEVQRLYPLWLQPYASRVDAHLMLAGLPCGTFMIRLSSRRQAIVLSYIYNGNIYDEYIGHLESSITSGVFLERTPQLLFENLERFVYFFTKPTQYFPVPLLEPLSFRDPDKDPWCPPNYETNQDWVLGSYIDDSNELKGKPLSISKFSVSPICPWLQMSLNRQTAQKFLCRMYRPGSFVIHRNCSLSEYSKEITFVTAERKIVSKPIELDNGKFYIQGSKVSAATLEKLVHKLCNKEETDLGVTLKLMETSTV